MLPLETPYNSNVVDLDDTDIDTETETEAPRVSDGVDDMSFPDSTCSTPFVSAPSSPTRTTTTTTTRTSGYFFSAPASPMHFILSSSATCPVAPPPSSSSNGPDKATSFEFENVGSSMISSADELFFNGLIRPTKLSSHLQRPQMLAPLLDLEYSEDDDDNEDGNAAEDPAVVAVRGRDLKQLRCRSLHRKARSLSPLRSPTEFPWERELGGNENEVKKECESMEGEKDKNSDDNVNVASSSSVETTPSCSASSSRSSSERRNSKKWMFLKDLWLHRSKSEGRANSKDKFWSSISFSPVNKPSVSINGSVSAQKSKGGKVDKGKKPENGVAAKRRGPSLSAHELHYTANRAQAEEMKKRTYLPYKQGLFGCLGFSSKGYGALNGLARSLNPVSSR